MSSGDSIKIARIDENIKNLSHNFESHLGEDTRRFDMVLQNFGERMDRFETKIDGRFDKLETSQSKRFENLEEERKNIIKLKIDPLWDDKKARDGALGVGKWVAGIIGGIIGGVTTFFASQHGSVPPPKDLNK